MAITADRTDALHGRIDSEIDIPVAASTTVYRGGLYSCDASGYLVPCDDAAAQASKKIVMALEGVDNSSGANAAKSARCLVKGQIRLPASPIVQADLLKEIHATDNQTLALTSTNTRPLGRMVKLDGSVAVIEI